MIRPISRSLAANLIAVLASACAGGAQLPALPELTAESEPFRASGRVTDVYIRIARGAATCWFGSDGVLKGSHIFHAAVDPPSRGETAQVDVHEIDPAQASPWGRRAFRVLLTPTGDATSIAVDNIAMPEEMARRMRADVFQWAGGAPACTTKEAPRLPAAEDPPPLQPGQAPIPPVAVKQRAP